MAWCDVVEPRTLRACRIALGQSQAAFAAMLGVSLESYRTWDAGRRATPPKILARARALATHRDEQALLPLPVLALLIGVHVKTLRAAARDGRLLVTYYNKTTFRRLRARATPAAGQGVSAVVLWADGSPSRSSCTPHLVDGAGRLRRPHPGRAPGPRPESGAVRGPGGRRAKGRRLSVESPETLSFAGVLATDRCTLPYR